MEYRLLTSIYSNTLTEKVQKHLDDGWELYGSPNQTRQENWSHFQKNSEHTVFSQAVIKNDA